MGGSPNYLPSTGSPGVIVKSSVTNGMAGTLLQSSSISMLGGAYLILENGPSSESVPDRLSDTASITMRRGSMILDAATEGTSETIGPVSVAGYSTLTAQPGGGRSGQPGILTLASLSRLDHGVLLVSGKHLGDTSVSYHGGIVVTAGGPALVGGGGPAGSTTISIVPWAIASYSLNLDDTPVNSFATYDPLGGFRALNPLEFAGALGTNPNENVLIAASTTNNAATMVNSLVFGDDQGITIDGTGSIAITSGAFLFKGSADSAVNNSLIFGATEGIVTSGSDFDLLTLNGNLIGTGGLTTGGGTIALAGNNSGLVGQLTVNNLLELTSPSNLPGTGAISVYSFFSSSSSAGISVTGNVNVTRDLTLASGKVNLAGHTDTSAATFSGVISGPASLDLNQDTALGTVELSGTNTYSGSTTVEHGTLVIHSDSSLGNGGALSINATLRLAGDWTTSRLVYLPSSLSTIDTGGHSAVLNNLVSGAGNLTKQGEGTLTLNQPFIHTGDSSPFIKSEVDAGTLVINNLHAGSMYVNAGTLGGGGTIAGFALVGDGANPGATLAPAAGGNQPKTLTFGEPITFNSDSTYTCFIKARGSQIKSDKVVSNHVTINGGTFALTGQIQGALTAGTVFTAINNTGSQKFDGRGTFTNLPEGGIVSLNGTNFQASYKGGTGNDLTLTVVP
jgi:autotransporter-associated beta strand protein